MNIPATNTRFTTAEVRERARSFAAANGPLLALLALLLICAISSAQFRQPQNLLLILRQNAYTGMVALGMTAIIISGGIDLSVGSLFALAGGLGVLTVNALSGASPALAVAAGTAAALGTGLIGGALNGALITMGGLPPFIATLGTMSIFRSLILHFGNAGQIGTDSPCFAALEKRLAGLPVSVWLFLLLTVVGAFLLRYTRYGRHLCAVGGNERVARYAAIPVARVKFFSYVICGFLCGLAAILQASRLSSVSSSSAGNSYELDAIAMVIIGGTSMAGGRGTITGTLIGAMILGIISNILVMWSITPNLQGLIKGLVIIVAVLIQRKR